ncbi:hypothetical protein [Bacillus paranthracis]|uniref:hypothetical protein n=1 Tax=Bacillus paranthracis TaxID=2026186 RepID=UPI0021D0F75B|nr:hypothetical protein [Bacillus paranthracis]MCU5209205.1 hypothetical protein [Bacillus paranthracis]HDR7791148.1 hypothetical protein [Bacillus paranthracis]
MTETLCIEELNAFLPLASLEALPAEEQKMRLQYWKEHFTNKEITAGLGTYNSKLYELYKKHEIPLQGTAHLQRKGKERTPSKDDTPIASQQSKTTEPVQTQTSAPTIPMQEVPVIPKFEPTTLPVEPIESCHIHYAGCQSKQKIIHQLQALATLLEEASHEQYQFSIQIDTPSLK